MSFWLGCYLLQFAELIEQLTISQPEGDGEGDV